MFMLAVQESLFEYFPTEVLYSPDYSLNKAFFITYSSFFGITSLGGTASLNRLSVCFSRVSSKVGDSAFSDVSLVGGYKVINSSFSLYAFGIYSSTRVDDISYSSFSLGGRLDKDFKRGVISLSAYNLAGARIKLESGEVAKVPFIFSAEARFDIGERLLAFASFWTGLFNYYSIGASLKMGQFIRVGGFYTSSEVAPYGVLLGYTKENLAFHVFYAFSELKYIQVSASIFM